MSTRMPAVTVSWALDFGPNTGFKFAALHPGGIRTESGLKAFQCVSNHEEVSMALTQACRKFLLELSIPRKLGPDNRNTFASQHSCAGKWVLMLIISASS